MTVDTKIVSIGNSLGIRLPMPFLKALGANAKDTLVSIELENDSIIVCRHKAERKRKSYEEMMEEFYGKPFSEIDVYFDGQEMDWGQPTGKEVW